MKLKFLALSLALAAATVSVNAKNDEKCKDYFLGGGVGIISTMTPDFNTPAFYADVQFGKYLTPVWAVRGVVAGPFQTLDANDKNAWIDATQTTRYSAKNKKFGELNFDAMFNISNLFADDLAKLDFYVFAGPTVNFSRVGTKFSNVQDASAITKVENCDDFKLRVGATAGLGLAYNFTKSFALGVEGRFGVTPSIFGDADAYRKASGTSRFTINGVWNIGGKRGKVARAAAAAAAAGFLSQSAVDAIVDEALTNNPKIVEKIVEKEVIKEVEKLVNNEVPSSTAIFFEIGKATLASKDKARIKLYAESILASKDDSVFEVAGYADKKTGSAKTNQKLSEKRAQAVYDALIAEGVPASRLEKKAYGGVDAIFFNNDVLSRTVIIRKK